MSAYRRPCGRRRDDTVVIETARGGRPAQEPLL
jgi:hypothetical protein